MVKGRTRAKFNSENKNISEVKCEGNSRTIDQTAT